MSEHGAIPEGWVEKTLEELCISRGLVRGPFGGTLKKEIFTTSGYKIYEQQNAIYKTTQLGNYYITHEKYLNLSRFSILSDDFIVSCSGTIGKIYRLPENAPQGIINQALLKIRIDETKISPAYFQHYFESDIFQQLILDDTQGGAMKNLVGMDKFRRVPLFCPPLPEQHAIAEVLSDMDGYIASLEKLIAKKKAIKQGAMQELLTGKRRLLGLAGEWEVIELGNLLDYEQPAEYIVRSTKYTSSGIPVLTAGKSFILGYTVEREGIYSKYPVILFDDFLTISRYIDFPFKIKSSAVKLLKKKRKHDNLKLIFELMQMIEFTVVDHQRHWISRYSKIQLALPLPKEQHAIAAVLSDMDAEIEALTTKLNKAKLIKQGMMQELLTGRIRLVKQEVTTVSVTKSVEKNSHGYSEGYEDAVILVALVNSFGTEQHPFTAFDCQKFPYLFHRHIEGMAKGYKKFAAGPYNPTLKYRTARPIALGKKYIREHTGLYKGFITDKNAEEALGYFEKWYGAEPLKWLGQFRYIKNRKNELELLTTVDMTMEILRHTGSSIAMSTVKEMIKKSPAWKDKLTRPIFSDENITRAIAWSIKLFGERE